MTEFDLWLEKQGYCFVRFADDICIYVKEMQEGYQVYYEVERKLSEYALEINQEKKKISSVFSIAFLGYQFEKNGDKVLIKRKSRNAKNIWIKWHREAVEKVNQQYHIINDGILTRKDFNVLFLSGDKKIHIPVETTESINIYSEITLNTGFFEVLNRYKLNVNIYNRFGVYLGTFYPNNQRNRMKCLMKQVQVYQNPRKRLCEENR